MDEFHGSHIHGFFRCKLGAEGLFKRHDDIEVIHRVPSRQGVWAAIFKNEFFFDAEDGSQSAFGDNSAFFRSHEYLVNQLVGNGLACLAIEQVTDARLCQFQSHLKTPSAAESLLLVDFLR